MAAGLKAAAGWAAARVQVRAEVATAAPRAGLKAAAGLEAQVVEAQEALL
jgi:hypothetical protein